MRHVLVRLAALLALAAAPVPSRAAEAPLRVLATTGMLADVARNVGGDCVEAEALIGPGLDPHLYQATASDVRRLQRAELILFHGHGLEGQLGAVLDRLGESRPVRAIGPAAVPTAELIPVAGLYGIDPHLWMDVRIWAMTVPVIAAILADLRPDCSAALAGRASRYGAELAALHDWVARAVASIPEGRRVLVTAHDAFGYYARAYGLRVAAVQGLSTESEASVADIRDVAEAVVAAGVPAVFVETTINPRTIAAMLEAVRAAGREARIGGTLFSDAMGEAGTPEGTYIGMLRANTIAIVAGLGGQVPPLPEALAGWAAHWGLE